MITGLAAAAGLLCLVMPAQASASPPGDACPTARSEFALWDVSTEPYGADNAVDEHGNSDGWVCARPIYVVTDEDGNPFQIYNFIDNVVVH